MKRQLRLRMATLPVVLSSAMLVGTPTARASARSAPIEPRAGAWKTWVVTHGSRIETPPPPGQKATKEEVAELLSLQARRGKGELEKIRYWDSGSPSYRWNELAFKTATESSSGVVTERMLALLNVAVYDATIAAWHEKYKYGRRRPAEVDAKLLPAVPDPESPSYPSEHAVSAGAASTSASITRSGSPWVARWPRWRSNEPGRMARNSLWEEEKGSRSHRLARARRVTAAATAPRARRRPLHLSSPTSRPPYGFAKRNGGL